MPRLIFASHGSLCEGMKESVSMIIGQAADCIETRPLYPGQNPQDFLHDLTKEIDADPTGQNVLILCDVLGGSVHTALSELAAKPNVTVFSGMNLGLALESVMQVQQGLENVDYTALAQSAREGITVLQNQIQPLADEEF